jgi:hypothetical protein
MTSTVAQSRPVAGVPHCWHYRQPVSHCRQSLRIHQDSFENSNNKATLRKPNAGSDASRLGLMDSPPCCQAVGTRLPSPTLAQALWDLSKTRSKEEIEAIISKIRVYDDAGQDNAGAWICNQFPKIIWCRNRKQVFSLYCGGKHREAEVKGPYTWEPYTKNAQGQHDWADEHVKKDHGPLGALYPDRFGRKGGLEGGGTTSWIGLANKGLYDPEHITWGGWGGRFTAEKQLNVPARYESFLEEPYKPFFMFTETTDDFTGEGITGFDQWVYEYRNPLYIDPSHRA